jgi:hypothetical protein
MMTKVPLITNAWDRDNLNFLLNTDESCLKDWHAQADADDLVYARELLDAYSEELRLKALELRVECEMELKGTHEANVVIQGVLDKFKK